MKTPKVVIGANYGDEGKGLITDYLCVKHGVDVVVRFNGGAQAGHTVVTPSGERHVFSHLSSGTFAGAATFLSKYFVVNPMIFFKELGFLVAPLRRTMPDVIVDPYARVTTPYDMIINQVVEQHRAINNGHHGSCGVGFGETVERCDDPNARLLFNDLGDIAKVRSTLEYIRQHWVPHRLGVLGFSRTACDHITKNDTILNNFLADCAEMHQVCRVETYAILEDARQILFEGAQGLLLDQNSKGFPHVTRSHTGLMNVLDLARAYGELDVTYVTRSYLTRHGNGPLPNELDCPPYPNVKDETNVPNTYQGALRYAYLDADQLRTSIQEDMRFAKTYGWKINAGLAVTCLDQLADDGRTAKVYMNGALQKLTSDPYGDVADAIHAHVGLSTPVIKVAGPTRSDVTQAVLEVA